MCFSWVSIAVWGQYTRTEEVKEVERKHMQNWSPTPYLKALWGLTYYIVSRRLCLLGTSVERLRCRDSYKIFFSHNSGKSWDRVGDGEINGTNSWELAHILLNSCHKQCLGMARGSSRIGAVLVPMAENWISSTSSVWITTRSSRPNLHFSEDPERTELKCPHLISSLLLSQIFSELQRKLTRQIWQLSQNQPGKDTGWQRDNIIFKLYHTKATHFFLHCSV